MALKTINLHRIEDGALIKILTGIHRVEPVGSIKDPKDGAEYLSYVLDYEEMDMVCNYEQSYARAERNGDLSEAWLMWRYVNDQLMGNEPDDGMWETN